MEGEKGVFLREDWEFLLVQIASERAGVDFFAYRMTTLQRRYLRRMAALNLTSLADYVALLERDPREVSALASDFLIGVTSFFRDPEAFRSMERKVLPELFERAGDDPVRVWVAGCSRGHEVCSIAMLLQSHVDERGGDYVIFATDVSKESIGCASKAVFGKESGANLPERYRGMLAEVPEGFTVIPEIRRRLVFNRHDLLEDPPFSNTDLVSCRNLVMYLKEEGQRRVMGRLLFSLKKDGFLFMGSGESPAGFADCLDVVDETWRIYRKRAEPSRSIELFFGDSVKRPERLNSGPGESSPEDPVRGLFRTSFDTCLNQTFVPSCVFVDESFRILHLNGDLNEFLSIPTGFPHVDLLSMLPPEFRGRIRAGVREVMREDSPVRIKNIPWQRGGVDLGITRVSPAGMGGVCLITFNPVDRAPEKVIDHARLSSDSAARIADLENQLDSMEQELRLVRRELATRTEELQTLNEELLTGGEEIRSTNEELQAINEELLSANEELKARNRQLCELHADLANLLQSLDIAAIFLGKGLKIRKYSEAARQFFRFSEKDLGRPVTDIASVLSGSTIRDILDRVERVIIRGDQDQWELDAGELGWFLAKITPHRDDDGSVAGAILSFVDVTGLKNAENSLRGLEKRLRRTHAMAIVGCWDFLPDAGRIWLTGATREIMGVGSGEETLPFIDFCRLFRNRDGIREAFDDLAHSRSKMDISGALASSPDRFVRLVAELEYDSSGDPVRVSGAAQDVTGIMEARRMAEEAHDYLKRIQKAAGLGGVRIEWNTGTGQSRVDLSHEAVALLGVEHGSEGAGVHLRDIVSEQEWENIREVFLASARHDETSEVDFSLSGGISRRKRVFHLRGGSEMTGEGILRTTGVVMDVTDLRQIEQELRHSEKLRSVGELAGGIAHDFNNQLMGIVGYAENLEKRVEDPELTRMARGILKASKRSGDLIRQLLAFSRKGMSVVASVDLHKVVADVVSMLERSVDRKIEITKELNAGSTLVSGDESQLNNALLNILLNSRDALPEGGLIRIATKNITADPDRQHPCHIELMVEDNGKGMEPGVLERAVEPFFTTKPVGHGTGMGLSAVYGTVNAHGGQMEIESEPGSGTRVRMILPLALSETPEPDRREAVQVIPGTKSRILVVDDEEMVREILTEILVSGGYSVCSAGDGERAVRVFRSDPEGIDLVLMDMTMPKMNGLDAFLQMKKLNPSVRVMVLSGHSADGTALELRRHGIRGVLQKPVTAATLLREVAACLS